MRISAPDEGGENKAPRTKQNLTPAPKVEPRKGVDADDGAHENDEEQHLLSMVGPNENDSRCEDEHRMARWDAPVEDVEDGSGGGQVCHVGERVEDSA